MNMKEATKKMKQDSPKLAGLSEAQRNLEWLFEIGRAHV